jgi:hypothetical protein
MYSSTLLTPSFRHHTERRHVQRLGHEATSPAKKPSPAKENSETTLVKSAIPTPSEFLISTGLGVIGGLLLSSLWFKHKIPQGTNNSLGDFVEEVTHLDQPPPPKHQDELVTFLGNPAVLFMMIPVLAPHLTQPALGATGLLGLGYLGSNALSGLQEVWVRWQESQIRANLVGNLSTAYQQSIEAKTQIDEDNHAYAETQIRQILANEGIPNAEPYLSPLPFDCTPRTNDPSKTRQQDDFRHKQSNFAILPQNRSPMPRQARLGESSVSSSESPRPNKPKNTPPTASDRYIKPLQNKDDSPVDFKKASRWSLNAVGVGLGLGLSSMGLYAFKAVTEKLEPVTKKIENGSLNKFEDVKKELKELPFKNTLAPKDTEALLLYFLQTKEGLTMAGLFVAMGVMLSTIQFLVEGLREIEVTRLNAETEKQYESYKLTKLEPHFKAISERSQLNHALANLKKGLQEKTMPPEELHQQIQRILDNIGYNWSAPNYYPMAPATQLVTARS